MQQKRAIGSPHFRRDGTGRRETLGSAEVPRYRGFRNGSGGGADPWEGSKSPATRAPFAAGVAGWAVRPEISTRVL